MVTVATKLDVPIKLVFENKKRSSMLGLGDIVVPGIFVGLCLRFDHFLYYYRQRKLVPVELKTERESADGVVATQETQKMVAKPTYVNPQGQWGNWLWTRSRNATPAVKASTFPKTYFKAALFGYFLAMLTTLAMLLIFQHAQPALLYLVPGVVSVVWVTGAVRGELKEMWIYTEDGSLDNEDVIVEVDENGNVMKELEGPTDKDKSEKEDSEKKKLESATTETDIAKGDDKQKDVKKKKNSSRPVFAFIIEAPPLPTEDEQEEE
jgi:minor histocompatibility antigen H13